MGVWGTVKNFIMKMLRIQPAQNNRIITIREPLSYESNVLKNRIWYRGDPSELDQFFKQSAVDQVSNSRFWAAVPSAGLNIRKIHSGLPAMIADRLSDIVTSDLTGIDLETDELVALWEEISEDNGFLELVGEAIVDTLVAGDGAFKITVDANLTEYPIIEFFSGEQVDYKVTRGRLQEVLFYTDYTVKDKDYRLEEIFGRGYITYRLLNADGKEVPVATVPELAELVDVTYAGDFLMAIPLQFFKSPKWPGRGKSIFDSKSDSFDALDEAISQWFDAIRAGRVQKYIPEDLIPKNPETGALLKPNPFDNQFIKIGTVMAEDAKTQVSMVQPQILYEAFVSTYANALDMCLQGIMSPATLGIDLKKLDNAEAQREKEKATLYTRGKIITALTTAIPQVVDTALKVYDTMRSRAPGEYVVTVNFGEYAAPDFDAKVETVGNARLKGIMSIEQAVEELYGDSWTEEQKAEEVKRLKEEQGLIEVEEPKIKDDPDNRDDPDPDDPDEPGDGDDA
ncbi:MAG: capsid protein [Fastidiosipilaceae bacterium]|jgi:hypothetical protein